ncbi:hypothetical protein ACTL6U_06150 [Rhodovibrionaceae bacterium A322]
MTGEDLSYTQDNNFREVLRSPAKSRSQFKTNTCGEIFDWYQSFAPNRPRRDQFDILDHVDKAPNIFLVAVLGDGRFEYRLHGEEVARLIGKNNAGVFFSPKGPDLDLSRFARYLSELCHDGIAMHSYGTLSELGKAFLTFEAFDFPLVDEQGNITHVLGVISLTSKDAETSHLL